MPDQRLSKPSRLFSLHQPHLLVLGLTSPTPFRWHINSLLFLLVTLLFGLVNGGWLVLRRRIHRVQYQRSGPSVDELMLSCCWNDDQVSCLDVLVLARNRGFAGASGEGQNLVDGVCLEMVSKYEILPAGGVILPLHQYLHPQALSSAPAASTSQSTEHDGNLRIVKAAKLSCPESKTLYVSEGLMKGC